MSQGIATLEELAANLRAIYGDPIGDDKEPFLEMAERACDRLADQDQVSPLTLACIVHDFLYLDRPAGALAMLRRRGRDLDRIAGFDSAALLAVLEGDGSPHLRAVQALYRLKVVNYDAQERRSSDAFVRAVRRLRLPPTPRVLDLGCGTGRTGEWLAMAGISGDLVGVDISEDMLSVVAGKGLYRNLIRRDIVDVLREAPSACGGVFDLVVMLWVAAHMGRADFLSIIEYAPRLLSGAQACFVFDTFFAKADADVRRGDTGLHALTRAEIEAALKAAGFTARHETHDGLALYRCWPAAAPRGSA